MLLTEYSPPLFVKFKTLLMSDPKQSIALKCAASGISIYSPHTALDSCVGGINDWLVRGLGPGKTLPVSTIKDQPEGQDGCGVGRIHYLEAPTTLNEISKRIKAFLGLEYLRIGQSPIHNQNKKIESVAVCAGSGASVLRNTRVDLYLTGEMSHHEVLDATSRDTSVVLCEHSNSERGYLLHELKPRLEREFGLEVVCSQLDTDPLKLYQ
ncbi:NGG1 interacting factor [Globomyces sp. JEL0801]|nr:NGG1 interacting factor [Globomyces sp. JEL0801]